MFKKNLNPGFSVLNSYRRVKTAAKKPRAVKVNAFPADFEITNHGEGDENEYLEWKENEALWFTLELKLLGEEE